MDGIFKIRDRHTGETLLQATAWVSGSLRGAYLGHRLAADLRSANLRGANLSETDLTGRDLSDADLTGTDLTRARYDLFTRWPEGVLPHRLGAVLVPADLKGARRVRADFSGLDLSGADLSGADLTEARLAQTKLNRARLRGTNLCGADLTGADLSGAVLTGVKLDEKTRLPADFERNTPPLPPETTAPQTLEHLSDSLKILNHPLRLRLLGWLLSEEMSAGELSHTLGLSPTVVTYHLNRLRKAGLIQVCYRDSRRRLRVDRRMLDERLTTFPAEVVRLAKTNSEGDSFEGRVLTTYFDGDRLTEIPSRRKKLMVVLQRLSREFEMVRRYDEREVSAILRHFHEDYATLRRALVDFRFLLRENGIYWRVR